MVMTSFVKTEGLHFSCFCMHRSIHEFCDCNARRRFDRESEDLSYEQEDSSGKKSPISGIIKTVDTSDEGIETCLESQFYIVLL